MDKARNEILSKLIPVYSDALSACSFSNLQEIRFRADRPVMLYYSCDTAYLAKRGGKTQLREEAIFCNQADIERQVSAFCRSSQYAYQEEIRAGFLTIRGGHRIGIGGKAVVSDSGILSLTAYSSLNIRIAREYLGSASDCMHYILKEETIQNTVIISPPGVGKTTVLRDLARQLSGKKEKKEAAKQQAPKSYRTIARALGDALDAGVKIKSIKGKNKIEIEFKDEADLERLFRKITAHR